MNNARWDALMIERFLLELDLLPEILHPLLGRHG